MPYEERTYRSLIRNDHLISYNVKISESDLFIRSDTDLSGQALQSLANHRHSLETYIQKHSHFRTSLLPVDEDHLAPSIVRDMIVKSRICGVGPMAGVAGAISEFVGRDLLSSTKNIIIENGGDIFLQSQDKLTVSIFAGESPLSHKAHLEINPEETPMGICTSSASVGPSLSFGKADAVCVLSPSATLADSAASAIGNRVKDISDIKSALNFGIGLPGIRGIVIICKKEMGIIGSVRLV